MTDTTADVLVGEQRALWATRLSLAEELALRGLRVMPREMVITHKRKVLREYRPGMLRFIAPTLLFVLKIFGVISLAMPLITWGQRPGRRLPSWIEEAYSCVIAISILTGLGLLWFDWWWPFALVVLMPFICLIGFGILLTAMVQTMPDAMSHWERRQISTPEGIVLKGILGLPRKLHERAISAVSIPGARIKVEHLEHDPFLIVVRGFGPWAERAVIGAWETGDPRLDNF